MREEDRLTTSGGGRGGDNIFSFILKGTIDCSVHLEL
jgi:hypothetical protein